MMPLLPSEELTSTIEQSEKDYMYDRMIAIQDRSGNPEGIEIQYFGNTLCLYSKTMPWGTFNTVKGLTSGDLSELDQILAFYKSRERNVQIEIVPSRVDHRVLLELSQRKLYPSGFHTSMYGEPANLNMPLPDHIKIKEIDTINEFTTYARIHCRGTGLPDNGIPHVSANNEVLWQRPGWKFFIAYVSDEPAAAAVMHVKDGVASLTFAATLPEFRKQGLHRFLLLQRLNEASQQGCRLVVGQCAYLSQSHRNMEHVGMKIGYVRSTWTEMK